MLWCTLKLWSSRTEFVFLCSFHREKKKNSKKPFLLPAPCTRLIHYLIIIWGSLFILLSIELCALDVMTSGRRQIFYARTASKWKWFSHANALNASTISIESIVNERRKRKKKTIVRPHARFSRIEVDKMCHTYDGAMASALEMRSFNFN